MTVPQTPVLIRIEQKMVVVSRRFCAMLPIEKLFLKEVSHYRPLCISSTRKESLWQTMLSWMEFVPGTTSKAQVSASFCSIPEGLGLTRGRLNQICRRWLHISTSFCRNVAV